ncbi:MAG TPA: hypothetical protein VN648_02945, partial [Candidatus Methylomirabilis sp.]|nr:hypothetical protein [Candidatus Methylomirabilis sp.]
SQRQDHELPANACQRAIAGKETLMNLRVVVLSIVLLSSLIAAAPGQAGELQVERIFGPEVKTGPYY